MANYIYCRVSDDSQNLARQLKDIEHIDIPENNVYVDMQSGKDFIRAAYMDLMKVIRQGDVIYFHSIDRMGRNYDEILEQWRIITKEVKADVVILDMPILDTRVRNEDLTGKFIADMVLQILSYVAQKERENIKQRQKEGIAIAKAEGKFRKKDIDMELYHKLKEKVDAGKMTVTAAAKELGVTRATYYNILKTL